MINDNLVVNFVGRCVFSPMLFMIPLVFDKGESVMIALSLITLEPRLATPLFNLVLIPKVSIYFESIISVKKLKPLEHKYGYKSFTLTLSYLI